MTSNTATSWKARDFAPQGIDGKIYSLAQVRGPKGTLVVFICNHCPRGAEVERCGARSAVQPVGHSDCHNPAAWRCSPQSFAPHPC